MTHFFYIAVLCMFGYIFLQRETFRDYRFQYHSLPRPASIYACVRQPRLACCMRSLDCSLRMPASCSVPLGERLTPGEGSRGMSFEELCRVDTLRPVFEEKQNQS